MSSTYENKILTALAVLRAKDGSTLHDILKYTSAGDYIPPNILSPLRGALVRMERKGALVRTGDRYKIATTTSVDRPTTPPTTSVDGPTAAPTMNVVKEYGKNAIK